MYNHKIREYFWPVLLIWLLAALQLIAAWFESLPVLGAQVRHLILESNSFARQTKPAVSFVNFKVLSAIDGEKIPLSDLSCQLVTLPWRNQLSFERGQRLIAKVKIQRSLKINQEVSIIPRLLSSLNISALQVRTYCKVLALQKLTSAPNSLISKLRLNIAQRIYSANPQPQVAGLMLSMSLGFRGTVSVQLEEILKRSGLMHLMVVSGFQVSLIYALAFGLFKKVLSRSVYIIETGYLAELISLLALIAAFIFVSLCDFDQAAVRALVTITLFVLARSFELKISLGKLFLASAFFCMLWQPLSFLTASFHLSFAALAGIGMGVALGQGRPVQGYLLVNLLASFFTSVISYLWFGSFSWLGLLLNPILAPLLGFAGCPLVIIAVIFDYCGCQIFLKILSQIFLHLLNFLI